MEYFDYSCPNGLRGRCGVEVTPLPSIMSTLVVVTELDDNPGMSVTNAAEHLASQFCARKGISPNRLLWIEHYPAKGEGRRTIRESWDFVSFGWDWSRGVFGEPEWRPTDRRRVDALKAGSAEAPGRMAAAGEHGAAIT